MPDETIPEKDYWQLLVSLIFAPISFIAAMIIWSVLGLELEKVIVYPAVLAAIYPVAIFFGVNRIAFWLFWLIMPVIIIPGVLRHGGATLTPVGVFLVLVVVAATHHILMGVWKSLAVNKGKILSTLVTTIVPYGVILALAAGYDKNNNIEYWLSSPKDKMEIARENGWVERMRSAVKNIKDPEDLAAQLCFTSQTNNIELVDVLLEAGADPLKPYPSTPARAALSCAAEAAAAEVFLHLVKHIESKKPNYDWANLVTSRRESLFKSAVMGFGWDCNYQNTDRRIEIFKAIKSAGGNPMIPDSNGKTVIGILDNCDQRLTEQNGSKVKKEYIARVRYILKQP